MSIDHLIYAAPRLADAVDDIERRFGVRATGGGQHVGQGTHNALASLGPRVYLELIAPDPAQPEPAAPRPYGVDGIRAAGLVGWAVGTDDIDAAAARARAAGIDVGEVIGGARRAADGSMLRWRLTSNSRAAGVIPFLIDWGDTPHPAASAPTGLSLEAVRVEHPDPAVLAAALSALGVDVEVRAGRKAALVATLRGRSGIVELR